ncbi:Eukaryotic peptide chain release factor GTP-binding subunit [Coemansia sp. Benny D115]|nr:Eukaryotic peptide chain release factor GTP-binding subunit [Coemansia sp. Benny D115]
MPDSHPQQPSRPTIVQLTPAAAKRNSVVALPKRLSESEEELAARYTPRTLIESTKQAYEKKTHHKKRHSSQQEQFSVPEQGRDTKTPTGQKHYAHDYPPHDTPKKSPPLQATTATNTHQQLPQQALLLPQSTAPTQLSPQQAQFLSQPSSPISRQSTTSPTAVSFAAAAGPGAREHMPQGRRHHHHQQQRVSSIQFLGPERNALVRMSMNEQVRSAAAGPTSLAPAPHTRTNSDGTDVTASGSNPPHPSRGKPQPVGLYEPVSEKSYNKHPHRYTSDGHRLKEPIYRLYDHRNWHPFCGLTVTGSRPAPFLLAIAMIAAPVVVFAVLVCPYLWTELHKAAVIVFAYLTALTFASMMMSSFTDPGIIPRNLDAITPPDNYVVPVRNAAGSQLPQTETVMSPGQESFGIPDGDTQGRTFAGRSSSSNRKSHGADKRPPLQYHYKLPPPWVHVGAPGRHGGPTSVYDPLPTSGNRGSGDAYRMYPPMTKLVTINNTQVRLKYCETCRIYRPPRASHCRLCDNCVENEDHHCIWLNNCIGRRNYRYFYSFLFSTTALGLYIIAFSLVRLILPLHRPEGSSLEHHESFAASIRHHPVVLALIIYVFINLSMVGGLFAYHTILISRNITTHEVLGAKSARFGTGYDYEDTGSRAHSRRPMFLTAVSPYSEGSCLSNWAATLCSPSVPSNVRWRTRVDPEGIEELAT